MCPVEKFNDYTQTIVTYGYLRGAGDVIKKVKNFFYIDHGYFKQSDRSFQDNKTKIKDLNGYFRIVFNDYWHHGKGNKSEDRLSKLNIKFKNINKNGDYIILSSPTLEARKYYNLINWEKETIDKIKQYSDREIILHNRNSKKTLDQILPKAWAFVSDHSSAGFKSMINGVPAYFTNKTLNNIGALQNIEKHEINYSIFNNLAYEQWNISEINSGEAWEYLSSVYT
tara:strand:+ start:10722 stop:11399 length:678 start_codon:yes stop_codon:yes gene_type:complete